MSRYITNWFFVNMLGTYLSINRSSSVLLRDELFLGEICDYPHTILIHCKFEVDAFSVFSLWKLIKISINLTIPVSWINTLLDLLGSYVLGFVLFLIIFVCAFLTCILPRLMNAISRCHAKFYCANFLGTRVLDCHDKNEKSSYCSESKMSSRVALLPKGIRHLCPFASL